MEGPTSLCPQWWAPTCLRFHNWHWPLKGFLCHNNETFLSELNLLQVSTYFKLCLTWKAECSDSKIGYLSLQLLRPHPWLISVHVWPVGLYLPSQWGWIRRWSICLLTVWVGREGVVLVQPRSWLPLVFFLLLVGFAAKIREHRVIWLYEEIYLYIYLVASYILTEIPWIISHKEWTGITQCNNIFWKLQYLNVRRYENPILGFFGFQNGFNK